jgi:hypothetical protein
MPEELEAVAPATTRTPKRDWPQTIIAIGVVLTLCYVAELVLVVILVSTPGLHWRRLWTSSAVAACRAGWRPW